MLKQTSLLELLSLLIKFSARNPRCAHFICVERYEMLFHSTPATLHRRCLGLVAKKTAVIPIANICLFGLSVIKKNYVIERSLLSSSRTYDAFAPRCVGATSECSVHNENVNGSMEQHKSITSIVEMCEGSEETLFPFFSHLGCRAMLCSSRSHKMDKILLQQQELTIHSA